VTERHVKISIFGPTSKAIISVTGLGKGQSTNLSLLDENDEIASIEICLPPGKVKMKSKASGERKIILFA